MIDLNILKKHDVTVETLKKIFNKDKKGCYGDVACKIRDRIKNRIDKGIQDNLSDYRYWLACDMAWDTPFRQTTQTLVQGLLQKNIPDKDILSMFNTTDIQQMMVVYDKSGKIVTGPIEKGKTGEVKVSAPTFFHIFLPVCKAYVTIRAAAIVNSFRQVPMLKYEPAKSTPDNRARCEIITDRVELMTNQYGYFDVLKQSVMQMLHYSQCMLFPAEEWHSETQLRVEKEGGQPKKVVVKEGIRYHMPHPSRVFFDRAYRPSTINSDSGVQFGGYWRVTRFADVAENKHYWNKDKVTYDGKDLIADNPTFFNTVYSSCAVRFGGMSESDNRDRETNLYNYASSDRDKAVTISEYYEKVIPKDEGIGTYEHPVWFRYVVAGADCVIYAAPLPYNPMVFMGYDQLETRTMSPSMTLECLPFQDEVSQLLSQHLLTIRQNLANVTFFDTNQVDKETMDWIKNLGEGNFRSLNFAPMDMRSNRMGDNKLNEAFQSFTFPKGDTGTMLIGISRILELLERMLVISPQELAQTASHELTAEEVKNINNARSTRFEYTMGSVERGIYALKTQLYNGLMAYGEDDIYARLPLPVKKESIKRLGFTVEHDDDSDKDDKYMYVKGKKTALMVDSFASNRDGDLRISNVGLAAQMVQMIGVIMGNQMLMEEVGVDQLIKFINETASVAGMPRDFKITATGKGKSTLIEEMQGKLAEMAKAIKESTMADIGKEVIPAIKAGQDKIEGLAQATGQIAQQVSNLIQVVKQMGAEQQQINQQHEAAILQNLRNSGAADYSGAGGEAPPMVDSSGVPIIPQGA